MSRLFASDSLRSDIDVAKLLVPQAFAHAVGELRLKETHLSWLILSGSFAYKIKKPVRMEFVDASTLERRHYLCEEELRLNRRLAAELYIDVQPVTVEAGQLRIGGAGVPIEYAVKMRQFDGADELQNLLDTHAVTAQEICALADLLSAFHDRAPVAPTGPEGPAGHTLDVILGNLAGLVSQLQRIGSTTDLGRIARWLQERVERESTTLEQRGKCGYVRDCHGDLHAGNVVRFHKRLLPFDCLEFDPHLRAIDVLDDLSFLVMDLSGHGRNDLAIALLSRYLEHSGDYAGLRLVPLFAVHRALVRAKIDALSIAALPEQASEFRSRLQRRLRGAEYWSTSRQPLLVLMHGASGSGKSWLSERLVPALPAIRIRSDLERKRLGGVTPDKSAAAGFQAGIYSPQFTHRTYARLCECAESALQSGFSAIVDAAFLESTDRELLHGLATRLGVRMVIVACSAAPEVLAQRIEARTGAGDRTSDANLNVLTAQLENLQSFTAQERSLAIAANTQDNDVVNRVLTSIESQRAASSYT